MREHWNGESKNERRGHGPHSIVESVYLRATQAGKSLQSLPDRDRHFIPVAKTRCLPKNGSTSVYTRPSTPQFPVPHTPLYSSASCGIPNSFSLCVKAWLAYT